VSWSEIILLFSAAVVGGTVNSVAGGGGFIVFPALLFTGMPPINANATNTVALWPGTLASTGAYRKTMSAALLKRMLPLFIVTFVGSVIGAYLLLKTPQQTFLKMVPWLLLGATVLLAFGRRITAWTSRHHAEHGPSLWAMVGVTALQACIAIYLGYFGGGAGIVVLALLAVMGMDNIHAMNGLKNFLVSCGNGVALVIFIAAHAVFWPQALLMIGGAVLGGYGGAHYAQKLNPRLVRAIVIAIGSCMTVYFFWKTRGM